jgi:hypothetical protein
MNNETSKPITSVVLNIVPDVKEQAIDVTVAKVAVYVVLSSAATATSRLVPKKVDSA